MLVLSLAAALLRGAPVPRHVPIVLQEPPFKLPYDVPK